MIVKRYEVTVWYVPSTDERGRIKYFDEIDDALSTLPDETTVWMGTPASDPFVEVVTEDRPAAEEVEKKIIDILTRFGCRVFSR